MVEIGLKEYLQETVLVSSFLVIGINGWTDIDTLEVQDF